MNKVILVGRQTKDSEVRYGGQNNTAVCHFTVAVDRQKKDAGTDFITCVAFGSQAELIGKYGCKGMKWIIEGHITTGSYDKDGSKVYTTDVTVERIEFAESKNSSDRAQTSAPQMAPGMDDMSWMQVDDSMDDMPFN